ncbi:suppressor of fused domain protein [Kribbella deserti]|uniref:Suppressor of fused domain protein n=1 Tax=Kribbella deserti TaxID=1926257 RepID=A0ABV6QXH9_9ACTN
MDFTDHLAAHLGPGAAVPADSPDGSAAVVIWRFENDESVSFATAGLAEPFGQELVCSVRPGQDGAGRFLLTTAVELVLKGARGLENLQIIRNNQPLLARTGITGLLVATHPYLPAEFNTFGEVEIRSLIPLTDPEIFLADAYGADVLTGLFEQEEPDLLDVTRAPVFDRRSGPIEN